MKQFFIFSMALFILSACKKKLIYKKIETKNYILEGYTYGNNTDKVFPNKLVLINKIQQDTVFQCENCYNDFHMILEDTVLIYGGKKIDSVIDHRIILKKIPVPQDYKYNIPYEEK